MRRPRCGFPRPRRTAQRRQRPRPQAAAPTEQPGTEHDGSTAWVRPYPQAPHPQYLDRGVQVAVAPAACLPSEGTAHDDRRLPVSAPDGAWLTHGARHAGRCAVRGQQRCRCCSAFILDFDEELYQIAEVAERVEVAEVTLTADLSDGRTISVPLAWYPRLVHATPPERQQWRLVGGGVGVHWPDLDEDLSVERLLAGRPSVESQRSFKRWLEAKRAGAA